VPELAWQRGEELDLVGGASRVATIRGQGPSNGILRVRVKLDVSQEIPEADILLNVFDSERVDRNVRDPVVVREGVLDRTIFPLGSLEDEGGQVFWRGAVKPRRTSVNCQPLPEV
jgi:hypothetical protein